MAMLFLMGDSITWGAWDHEEGGWAARLGRWLNARLGPSRTGDLFLYNLGVAGDTSDALAARFEAETQARFRDGHEYFVIVAIGANDATRIPSQDRFKVEPEAYGPHVAEVIRQAQAIAAGVTALNITAVNDQVAGAPPGEDRSRLNRSVQKFNRELESVCGRMEVPVIDVFSRYQELGSSGLLADDGFHPNAEGHRVIFKAVRDHLIGSGFLARALGGG